MTRRWPAWTGGWAAIIRLLGASHPGTLACASNLSRDLEATGDGELARELSAETQQRYTDTLGANHPDTVVALSGGRVDPDFDPPPI